MGTVVTIDVYGGWVAQRALAGVHPIVRFDL